MEPCHDLKTERPDIGQPLPKAMMLIPMGFYLILVGAAALNTLFYFQYRSAETQRLHFEQENASQEQILNETKKRRSEIDLEKKRAKDLVGWVDGSDPLQPVVMTVIRSMDANSVIEELSLTRKPDDASSILFGLKFSADPPQETQLNKTLEEIQNKHSYGAFYKRSTQKGDQVTFNCELVPEGTRGVAAAAAQ
ncbi:MAG: hypothetical protein R3F11_13375 [Verrucomicrobiales bacterium]